MFPCCACCPHPPLTRIVCRHGFCRRRENQRSRLKHFIRWLGSSFRHLLFQFIPVDGSLRHRFVSRCIDELRKLSVGHFRRVHPKSVQAHAVYWSLVGARERVHASHRKFSSRNQDHADGSGLCWYERCWSWRWRSARWEGNDGGRDEQPGGWVTDHGSQSLRHHTFFTKHVFRTSPLTLRSLNT